MGPARARDSGLRAEVRDRGGHYLAFVKDNQPTLLHDIQAALASEAPEAFSPSAAAAVGGNL